MKTSDFKKDKRVRMVTWKQAKKLCEYNKKYKEITVPFGDESGGVNWDKSDFKVCENQILILHSLDEDGDFLMTNDYNISPILLTPYKQYSFKPLY